MKKWQSMIKRLAVEEEGATAVEYGVMVALVAAVVIAAASTLGEKVVDVFDYVEGELGPPSSGSGGTP